MNPLFKFMPWAALSSVCAGVVGRSFLVGLLVWIAWWIAASVAHEICEAVKKSKS